MVATLQITQGKTVVKVVPMLNGKFSVKYSNYYGNSSFSTSENLKDVQELIREIVDDGLDNGFDVSLRAIDGSMSERIKMLINN